MPRVAIDYSKTSIYKIVCKDKNITDLYVGHTCNFSNRKNAHKQDCNNPKKNTKKIYKIINENGGWGNWEMIEIEKLNCNDSKEARTREHYYENLLQPTMNTNTTFYKSFDGLDMDNIIGKDKKETNKLKANFRMKKLTEELDHLRKYNKELNEYNKELNQELDNSIKENIDLNEKLDYYQKKHRDMFAILRR